MTTKSDKDVLIADKEAMCLAYGLLWGVTTNNPTVHLARRALLARMTKDMQKHGIEIAKTTAAKMGYGKE